jgi:hypothetical protein
MQLLVAIFLQLSTTAFLDAVKCLNCVVSDAGEVAVVISSRCYPIIHMEELWNTPKTSFWMTGVLT